MDINKEQRVQVSLAAVCLVLIILWLCIPGWDNGKILGIGAGILSIISTTLSFIAEEKKKAQQ